MRRKNLVFVRSYIFTTFPCWFSLDEDRRNFSEMARMMECVGWPPPGTASSIMPDPLIRSGLTIMRRSTKPGARPTSKEVIFTTPISRRVLSAARIIRLLFITCSAVWVHTRFFSGCVSVYIYCTRLSQTARWKFHTTPKSRPECDPRRLKCKRWVMEWPSSASKPENQIFLEQNFIFFQRGLELRNFLQISSSKDGRQPQRKSISDLRNVVETRMVPWMRKPWWLPTRLAVTTSAHPTRDRHQLLQMRCVVYTAPTLTTSMLGSRQGRGYGVGV